MLHLRALCMVFSILLAGISVSVAQQTSELTQVTVSYVGDAITVSPAQIPAGLTTIVMDNQTDSRQGGPFGRFKDGMTMDDFIAAAAENPFAAISVFDLYGSISGEPQSNPSVTVDLLAGDYVFLGSGGMMGMMNVTPSDTDSASLPEHDVNVVMVDFAYGTPSVIPAGEQVWRIRNEGEQLHEFLIVPVDAETTLDEATEIFRSMGSVFNVMDGTSTVEVHTIWGPLSPGNAAWVPINLEPGTYAVGGLLPDFTDMSQLQLDHGMIRLITVE